MLSPNKLLFFSIILTALAFSISEKAFNPPVAAAILAGSTYLILKYVIV